MCGNALDIQRHLGLALTGNAEVAAGQAGLHVEHELAALAELQELVGSVAVLVQLLLIGSEADLEGTAVIADLIECLADIQSDHDTALHVQNAGAMDLALIVHLKLAGERTELMNGIHVAAEDDGLSGTVLAENTGQHIAALVRSDVGQLAAETDFLEHLLEHLAHGADFFRSAVIALLQNDLAIGLEHFVSVGLHIRINFFKISHLYVPP